MRVEVITYDPLYAPDFARLNYEWIERFFAVEEEDRLALEHPQQYAIAGKYSSSSSTDRRSVLSLWCRGKARWEYSSLPRWRFNPTSRAEVMVIC